LLLLADKYDMSELVYMCQSELAAQLDEKNCFQIINLAAFIKASYLQDACLSFIYLSIYRGGHPFPKMTLWPFNNTRN